MASMSEAVFSNDNSQLNDRPMSAGGSTVDYDERGLSDISQPPVSYVAPALRVEELKDELVDDAVSGSSICGSSIAGSSICGTDDEFAVSAGDASDQDAGQGHTADESSEDFVPPDEDLQKRIVDLVEQYFSDENIIHDTFMLKHVRRNRLGYVSLKLVTSFRKVKPLTRDHRAVAYSLRHLSEKLEVNDEGTKVRRRDPLPEFDETTPSRSMIVAGLPMEVPTMDNISEMLSGNGEIVSIRIWRAGKPLPSDVKKHVNNLGAEYLTTACAMIEFDAHESAVKACENLLKVGNNEQGGKMVAALLTASKGDKAKKPEKGAGQAQKLQTDRENANQKRRDGGSQNQDGNGKTPRNKGSASSDWRKSARVDELTHEGDNDSAGSESDVPPDNWRSPKRTVADARVSRSSLSPQVDPNRLSPCQSPRSTPKSSPKSSPRTSPNARRKALGTSPLAVENDERRKSEGNVSSPSHSPWVQRRLKAQAETSISPLAGNTPGSSPRLARKTGNEDGTSSGAVSRFSDAVGVIRQPKGPDGTRGFNGGLGRGRAVENGQAVAVAGNSC